MAKQLILLAGLHKTGTTSIQKTCAANRALLWQAGLHYPTNLGGERDKSNHTGVLNVLFRRDPTRLGLEGQFTLRVGPAALAAYAAKVRSRLEGIQASLLMAAEGVSVFSVDELTEMKAWFARSGRDIRVICNVRHLSGWINSMVAQRVAGHMRLSIYQAVDEFRQFQSLVRTRIENIRTVFPDAQFYSHEQAVQHRLGPVGFFLENVGVPLTDELQILRANEGSSDNGARVLSLINQRFGRFGSSGARNPEFFKQKGFVTSLKRIPGRKFALRPDEVAPILPILQAENEWLCDNLGPAFYDEHPEFNDITSDWSPEGVRQCREVMEAMPQEARSWVLGQLNWGQIPISPLSNLPTPDHPECD